MGDTEIRQKLNQDLSNTMAETLTVYRDRLLQIIGFRLNPILSGRVDAEDVLQESWLAAHQRINHFMEDRSMTIFVWLRLIVLQTLTDIERRHLGTQKRDVFRELHADARNTANSTAISLVARIAATQSTPSKVIVRQERKEQLLTAIESMDELDREVLAMRHFEELTNSETAAVLRIKETAASNRYIRALKRLKDILNTFSDFHENSDDR